MTHHDQSSNNNNNNCKVIPNSSVQDAALLNTKLLPTMVNLLANDSAFGPPVDNNHKYHPHSPHHHHPNDSTFARERRNDGNSKKVPFKSLLLPESSKSAKSPLVEKKFRDRLRVKSGAFQKSMLLWGNNTTIHGISEIVSMSTCYLKLIWMGFLLIALAFLSFQIYRLALQFASNPTATRMGTTEIKDYPPAVTYCTNRAIDHEIVSGYGLDEYAIIDLMTTYFGASKLFVSETTIAKILHSRENVVNIFEQLNMTHFDDLMESITRQPHQLFGEPTGDKTIESIRKVGTRYGPCYQITFAKPLQRTYGFGSFQLFIKRPEIAPFIADLFKGTFTKDEIYFVTFGNKLVPYNIDGNSDATVKATYRKRFSTPENPCRYDDEGPKDVKLCQDACENRRMKKCFRCIVYSNTSRVDEYMCGFLDYQDKLINNLTVQQCYGDMNKEVDLCNRDCMKAQPCHDWIFDVFVLPRQFRDIHEGNSTVGILTLTIHEPYASLFMEEYYTYPLEQFVSDLGGQLGLFFGASVLSVLQLAYFCCCLPVDKESLRNEDDVANTVKLAAERWCQGAGYGVQDKGDGLMLFDSNNNANQFGDVERGDARVDEEDFGEFENADEIQL